MMPDAATVHQPSSTSPSDSDDDERALPAHWRRRRATKTLLGMSLYTPVFPPTDPPAAKTSSSSSLASFETAKQPPGLSYSSRLSQWHVSIASLPEELCPPSRPASPGSQARSAKLQADIERAVLDGRSITDLCKLRCTRLGYATKQLATINFDYGDAAPWILAETEDEWFEWEKKMTRRRSRLKGKERATPLAPPPAAGSQDAHDKVLTWKAGLQAPSSSLVTASPIPPASIGRSQSALGFPVVKRSTVKDNKFKAAESATPHDPVPRRRSAKQEPDVKEAVLQVDTRAINTGHLHTVKIDHDNSFSGLIPEHLNPRSDPIDARLVTERPTNMIFDLPDSSSFPPPSFPPNLPTSTQKDVIEAILPTHESLPSNLPESTIEGIPSDMVIKAKQSQEHRPEGALSEKEEPLCNKETVEASEQRVPQPTPPSPPYSSEASQPPEQRVTVLAHDAIPTSMTPPRSLAPPLTPPPEPDGPVLSGMLNSSHTPDRLHTDELLAVPRTNSYGYIRGGGPNGPATPDAAINGAGMLRAHGVDIGMVCPRTPERHTRILSDPLTTSRKSLPRPRPPSRKHSVQDMDIVLDGAASDAGDPSPAKSDRSYFSSPASGSSSGSDFSRASMMLVPVSPTPKGFTQDPSRFAPLAASTQLSSRPTRQSPGPNSQDPSPSKLRVRTGSRGMAMAYNSQFDVDSRVDELSAFMHRDVDLDAWVQETTDEEDDDHAVEEMTMAYADVDAVSTLG